MPKPVEKEQPTTEEARLLASISDTATLVELSGKDGAPIDMRLEVVFVKATES
jgi:hypothetical protein